jgi:hypothetical protein
MVSQPVAVEADERAALLVVLPFVAFEADAAAIAAAAANKDGLAAKRAIVAKGLFTVDV